MPFPIAIPFYGFRLHLPGGGTMLTPLNDLQTLRFSQHLDRLADQYREHLQREILDQGELQALLEEVQHGDFAVHQLTVTINPSRDGISYPSLELSFDYYVNERSNGFWGVLPTLGLEGFGLDFQSLEQNLREAVRINLNQDHRMPGVRDILQAIWYRYVELVQQELKLKLPDPREVDLLAEETDENLLAAVAVPLSIDTQQVFGRSKEIEQLGQLLRNKFNRNVLLVGPNGVGKTALVWEIARKRASQRFKSRIWETTASTLIKELSGDTGWQDRLAVLCQELHRREEILFVRNLMDLFEVGKYQGNDTSMAEYLLPYLSRGELSLISECTEEEMASIEIRTPNYLSNFQILRLETPPDKELEQIILQSARSTAQYQNVRIEDEAIRELVRLNRRFTPYAGMPGKAIRFLASMLYSFTDQSSKAGLELGKAEVVSHFCQDTGMPQFMIDPDQAMSVQEVQQFFHRQLFGQELAVEQVIDLLITVKAALNQTGKPIASLLFVGPTGVGKTELAKILAGFMFGNRNRMIRFDMSEYSSYYAVLRLTGMGYDSEGLLTGAVRRTPFCVLLFDEIEKAHPNFYDLLLQILGEGRLTDSQGKMVNFCSTIIIMTSNIGAEKYQRGSIGWQKEEDVANIDRHFLREVEQHFRPELFNRLDRVIPFRPLERAVVRKVVDREIRRLERREGVKFRRLDLKITEAVKDHLARLGYDPKYGARHLQRVIREQLIIPMAEQLNQQDVEEQLALLVDMREDKIHIETTQDPLGLELLIEELERNSYADYAGSLRRQMSALRECPVFIRLENELDLMERAKKRSEKAFWKDAQLARRYATYLDLITKTEQLAGLIDEKEMALGLACLELATYYSEVQQELQNCDQLLTGLKQEIVHTLDPKPCFLIIYGRSPQQIATFYFRLLEQSGFEYECEAIWYSEAYYSGEDWLPNVKGEMEYRPRHSYETTTFDPTVRQIDELQRKQSDLFGIRLRISGQCAYLYLSDEAGVQKWQRGDEEWLYVVDVQDRQPELPKNIHRSKFYTKQSPRRVLDEQHVRDTIYRINREYRGTEHIELIAEELDYRLKSAIDRELML